jgi:glycerol uptake facilitator-like aquaporin
MSHRLERRAAAEFLGTAVLVATVVGSGIMGTELSDNLAVTLLINAVATVAVLGVLIWAVGPISGAHFNPVVTGVTVTRKEMPVREAGVYVIAQVQARWQGWPWPT